jgi:hypothetical protein
MANTPASLKAADNSNNENLKQLSKCLKTAVKTGQKNGIKYGN